MGEASGERAARRVGDDKGVSVGGGDCSGISEADESEAVDVWDVASTMTSCQPSSFRCKVVSHCRVICD